MWFQHELYALESFLKAWSFKSPQHFLMKTMKSKPELQSSPPKVQVQNCILFPPNRKLDIQVEKQKSSALIIQFRLWGKSPFFTLLYEASFASKDFSVWSFWLICSSSCCYSIGRKLYLISSWINEKTPTLTRWPCLQCCMQSSLSCLEKILLLGCHIVYASSWVKDKQGQAFRNCKEAYPIC